MPRKMDDGLSSRQHQHHTPSRIPAPRAGRYQVKNIENGYEKGETGSKTATGNTSGKRFETFVMTGDMIIQTTSPHHKPETVKESPTQKRKREARHSPVSSKRDGRSNISKPTDSPKASPKRRTPQQAIIESPKASLKKVVHTAPGQQKEPQCPKFSPKNDNRKSPGRQSRLPRFTPKNSPKLAQKHPLSNTEASRIPDSSNNMELKDRSTNEGNLASGHSNNIQQKENGVEAMDTNGASPPPLLQLDKRQQELELLGYPRFPDIPVELDIPPDDISSEDEKFRHETMVDIDDLPPPPEEFFSPDAVVVQEKQQLSVGAEFGGLPLPECLPDPEQEVHTEQTLDMELDDVLKSEDSPTRDRAVLDTAQMAALEHNAEQGSECGSAELDSHQNEAAETTADYRQAESLDSRAALTLDSENGVGQDREKSGNVSPMHQDKDSGETKLANDKDNQVQPSDSDITTVRVEESKVSSQSTESPAHHGRSASVSETSAIDSSTNSISSDSKVELNKGSPSRTIVVSKSAEKITPNKTSSSSSSNKNISDHLMVRSSKSHENYLERNEVITFVDIDLDDSMASSVDALHHEKSSTSLDSLNYVQFQEQSHSVDASPDKHTEKGGTDRKLMPTFINLEEARSITKLREGAKLRDFSKCKTDTPAVDQTSPSRSKQNDEKMTPEPSPTHVKASAIPVRDASSKPPRSPKISTSKQHKNPESQSPVPVAKTNHVTPETCRTREVVTSEASDTASSIIKSPVKSTTSHLVHSDLPSEAEPPIATSSAPPSPNPDSMAEFPDVPHECQDTGGQESPESEKDFNLYHQPLKEIDRPSAARLAKRLFQLDGFRKGDITRHLCKKNDFSYLVGEEYLKFFNFTGMTLDQALRNFLKNLTLAGETQERERVLAHLSRRYLESNPGSFNSEDACHTLVCALMLLNTDLHGQNIGRKMTVNEFIENLADLNDGENFPKEILKNLYHSIKAEPLECHVDDERDADMMAAQAQDGQRYIGHNPFLDIPDPSKATEYKKGYVMRKCCVNADGRKTPLGKRGWKMFFATLRDMVLYLHKDDHAFKKNTMVASAANAIRIHHALAFRATDYKKKQHVFRLQTADWAQYLFQTSNSKECQEWIDTINFVAASLSAPPLPSGCGSQRKFERPLLPASYTQLNMREQAQHHEQRMLQVEQELHAHCKHPPEKGTKSRYIQDYVEKEAYLQFELKRFKVYSALLQMKLATFPELEPSLVEVAIGEVDEPNSLPSSPEQPRIIPLEADLATEQTITTSASSSSSSSSALTTSGQHRSSKLVQRSMSDRIQLEKPTSSSRDEKVLDIRQKSPKPLTSPSLAIPSETPIRAKSQKQNLPYPSNIRPSHTYETQV